MKTIKFPQGFALFFAIVPIEDNVSIRFILQMIYKKAVAIITELKGNYVICMSKTKTVADIIETAAKASGK